MLEKETKRMRELGVQIHLEQGLPVIIGGGEEAPDTMGYDACGMEVGFRFISIPSKGVRGPKGMSPARKAR